MDPRIKSGGDRSRLQRRGSSAWGRATRSPSPAPWTRASRRGSRLILGRARSAGLEGWGGGESRRPEGWSGSVPLCFVPSYG